MPLQELLLSERKLIISLLFYVSLTGYQFNIELVLKYLVYKGMNGLAPAYISELLHYRTSSRLLRSASFSKTFEHPKDISEDIWWQSFFRLLAPNWETNYLFITQIIEHFDCFQKVLVDLFV